MQLHVACIQMNSKDDMSANIAQAEALIERAASGGAELIALPENAFFMAEQGADYSRNHYAEAEHPGVLAMSLLAKRFKCQILIGSIAVPASTGKYYNRSLLINTEGEIAARYDKIHLFDVQLANGENYTESSRFEGGKQAVLTALPHAHLGMTICYDLRFPYLFRALAKAGALLITVPAAFTYTTGVMHWEVLLRARAIENGCFILAPAQCGMHPGNRRTYGHSLIIDPLGKILSEGSEDAPEIIHATLDMSQVEKVRKSLPSLRHDREFILS